MELHIWDEKGDLTFEQYTQLVGTIEEMLSKHPDYHTIDFNFEVTE
jgi:hypothetical protein